MTNPETQLQTTAKQEIDESFEQTRPGLQFTPAVDIFEGPSAITVLADMPGVKAEGLDVDLCEGVLTLTGRVADQVGEQESEVLREYESGTYYRQFRLSDAIDQAHIDAKLTHGVLRLELPKSRAMQPRKISVSTD